MSNASENSPPNDELTLVIRMRLDAFPYEKPYDIYQGFDAATSHSDVWFAAGLLGWNREPYGNWIDA